MRECRALCPGSGMRLDKEQGSMFRDLGLGLRSSKRFRVRLFRISASLQSMGSTPAML